MKSSLSIIIGREYAERVKRKSFIITTILMPIFMLVIMMLPAVIMIFSGPESKNIAVVDYSGVVEGALSGDEDIVFSSINGQTSLDSIKGDTDYDAILVVGSNVVDDPTNVTFYTRGSASMQTEQFLRTQIEDAVQKQRMQRYEIDNLKDILADIEVSVSMNTYRIDREQEEATSSTLSYFLGLIMDMMLYMFIMIYGQMVMTSIIEEKNNRVLEIIVSSVRPTTLMTGKVVGIGLVAVTQIVIWGVLLVCMSKWLMPLLTTNIGDTADGEMMAALSQLGDAGYIFTLMMYALLFMVGGFVFYSSIYAAIGSAVDNIQDASQLTSIALVPIMLGMMFSLSVITDPNSTLAFWVSIIPFTSPMAMTSRIPFGIPAWEIWLSLVLLFASSAFMLWFAGKIYRVGIFMYGKKPTFKEIVRWARYK